MKQFLVLGALLVASAATAQPVQPVPTASTPVSEVLAQAPTRIISNVLITARLASTKCMIAF